MSKEAERRYIPHVNRRRCEGKAECAAVCPHAVFEIAAIDEEEYRALPLFTRLKLIAHGKRTAYTPRVDACNGCGLCVKACPEHAIKLAVRGVPS